MTYAAWRQLTDHAEARLETLRHFAQQVFDDADSARRWLGSSNVAVGRGETPVAACATVPGFLEAMAELARIEAFQRRETARRLGVEPGASLVVEDSRNGVLAARAAGMRVVLVPNASVPPPSGTAELADLVLERLPDLLA